MKDKLITVDILKMRDEYLNARNTWPAIKKEKKEKKEEKTAATFVQSLLLLDVITFLVIVMQNYVILLSYRCYL